MMANRFAAAATGFSVAAVALVGCSNGPVPDLTVGDIPLVACGPTSTAGPMVLGLTVALSDVDVRITEVEPNAAVNMEVVGWRLASPTNYVGLGEGFEEPSESDATAHLLPAGEELAIEVGVSVKSKDSIATADSFTVTAATDAGAEVHREVPLRISLLPTGEVCD